MPHTVDELDCFYLQNVISLAGKMKCLFIAGLLALCSWANAQQSCPEISCPGSFTHWNGSCYLMSAGHVTNPNTGIRTRLEGLPFHQANLFCKTQHPDAHLLVLNNQAELEFIFNWIPSIDPLEVWVGLFYNNTQMAWTWVNGDPVTYTAWEPYYGEPLVTTNGAAMMFASEVFTAATTQMFGYGLEVSHFWMSEHSDEPLPFICECPLPVNSTFDTNNTTNTTGTNSTAQTPTTGAGGTTMAPQVLFQQYPQPIRLSDFLGIGGLQERKFNNRHRSNRPAYGAPQRYEKRGRYMERRRQNYGYGYPVMP